MPSRMPSVSPPICSSMTYYPSLAPILVSIPRSAAGRVPCASFYSISRNWLPLWSAPSLDTATDVSLPVHVDRLAVHSRAGGTDPEEFLLPHRLPEYRADRELPADAKPAPRSYPVGCYWVDEAEEPLLRQRLLESRVAVLVPESSIPRRADGRLLLAGMFCVAHKELLDRSIFDRRPLNHEEARIRWAVLPHGSQFCRLVLSDAEDVRGSGDDLRTYFYCLRQRQALRERNCFGRAFDGAAYADYGGQAGIVYRLALDVMAMGDHNAPDIAQACHEDLLTKTCGQRPWMRYGHPLPEGPLLAGIYLDDHLVACIVPADQPDSSTGPDRDLIERSHRAYEEANLPRAVEKGFGFSKVVDCPASADATFVA